MKEKGKAPSKNGSSKVESAKKRERTARISDEDWEDIRRAAKAVGKSAGDYFVDLHRQKGVTPKISPSVAVTKSALALHMTQLTRAIMQQEALSDDIFEELLALHILMQRIIETK
ncbi:hypothetical protein D3P06_17390 [Paracoccus aestuarii]|uniref:Uncharacterized protein n=1 Tax=Paracoccus aestuarii TaxID=453842 RepID=A0A418ZPN5_9RHOB|nr:hypothetical protein [Paracoccus aestuarii]RJK96640.1 hypothetical protein D3P06_17390 [Paracoccus aestuarii]WCQ98801.1 hypothetical protein JHW48_13150 [Paracoccus aestuarii]